MTATSPSLPIYKRFDHVDRPLRFHDIAQAYIDDIRRSIPDKSIRAILREAGTSHSLMYSFRTNPDRMPDVDNIRAIVDAINNYYPVAEKWPIEHAMVSGGRSAGEAKNMPAMNPGKTWRRTETGDSMPPARASVATNMFTFDVLQASGLEHSVLSRRSFNVSTDMGIILGRVPGYPLQRSPDEWVIFVHPHAERTIPDDAYALVRVGPQEVRAFPRQGYTKSQVIGWLIGIMYIPGALSDVSTTQPDSGHAPVNAE